MTGGFESIGEGNVPEGRDARPDGSLQGRRLTVAEMFCGPGGIGVAVNKARIKGLSFQHTWATDYDPCACETYRRNVLKRCPGAVCICKDVRELDIKGLEPADGLLFGFPCNDFSRVGEAKGLDGKFGGLYKYGVEYISHANPLFFVAENVTGLRSANDGRAFKQILNELCNAGEHGYTITTHLYRFEEYGIPQIRHRYILVGIRGDLQREFRVPAPSYRMKTCSEALADIPVYAKNQERVNIRPIVAERLCYIRPGMNIWQAESMGLLPKRLQLNVKGTRMSQIYRRLDPKRPAYTVTGSGGGGTYMYHWDEPRALTNREKARLQTFPDDFVFYGSVQSVRRQIGMAVPCEGARIILVALLKTMAGEAYKSISPSIGIVRAKTNLLDGSYDFL